MNYIELADLLFPDIKMSADEIISAYPSRIAGQIVTRMAPSPTGFLHIGAILTSFVNERFAHQNGGIFMLRIEDTDQKREVEGAVQAFIDAFKKFGIDIDEGPIGEGYTDIGKHGPYTQSQRENIYKVFIKYLISKGMAYPCFLSEQELNDIRSGQEKSKNIPGIYGKYSPWRDADIQSIQDKLSQGISYVIRLKSPGDLTKKVIVKDLLRGEIETTDNYIDVIIMKSSGLPTYHFAHVVDDYLMGTSHVIRADEWLPSLPLHLQMFDMLGWKAPIYVHISPLVKIDGNSKRKLSKRHDPEANVEYYFEKGYPVEAIIEYLANIVNSSFEDWQKENLEKNYKSFEFKLEKMNQAGALVDMQKLEFVSTEYISRLTMDQFYDMSVEWADKYDHYMSELMRKYPEYTKSALNIERGTPNDPKRFHKFSDIASQLMFFYDEEYHKFFTNKPDYPENITDEVMESFVEDYVENFSLEVSKEEWFEQMKSIAKKYGFAGSNAEFKEGGYIGKIGDIAMLFRLVLCGMKTTPDLYETMKVMGKDRVVKRLKYAVL